MHSDGVSRRHTHTHTQTRSLFLNAFSHTHAHALPKWPCRRACLCQQMSGRRCVFLCLSLHSFHPLLQRLPICLWPCYISAQSNLPPRERQCVCNTREGVESTTIPPQSLLRWRIGTTLKIRLVRLGPRSHYEVVFNEKSLFSTLAFIVSRAQLIISVTWQKKFAGEERGVGGKSIGLHVLQVQGFAKQEIKGSYPVKGTRSDKTLKSSKSCWDVSLAVLHPQHF